LILGSVTFAAILDGRAVIAPALPELPNFDKRVAVAGPTATETPAQKAAAVRAKARIPELQIDYDSTLASPKWVYSKKGFLSRPTRHFLTPVPKAFIGPPLPADPHEPAKAFLNEHSALFEHGAEVLTGAKITREFTGAHDGLRTIVWQQQLDGIPVFESILVAHITKNKELVNLSSLFVPDLEQAAQMDLLSRLAFAAAPPVSAKEAVAKAANFIGEQVTADQVTALDVLPQGVERTQRFSAPALQGQAAAKLTWLPMSRSALRLCWKVYLTGATRDETFCVLIDVQNAEPLIRHCLTFYANEATYRVFTSDSPSPFSPGHSSPNTTPAPLG